MLFEINVRNSAKICRQEARLIFTFFCSDFFSTINSPQKPGKAMQREENEGGDNREVG